MPQRAGNCYVVGYSETMDIPAIDMIPAGIIFMEI